MPEEGADLRLGLLARVQPVVLQHDLAVVALPVQRDRAVALVELSNR